MDTPSMVSLRPPWHTVRDEGQLRRMQRELEKEVSPVHPLWNTGASVFAQHQGCDDVLVALRDGRFAIVHLVWHGRVDQYPGKFPSTTLYEDAAALQKGLGEAAADWE